MSDIVVTWPKTRRFGSYVSAVHAAKAEGLVLNYRVHNPPPRKRLWEEGPQPPRLYRVHDGFVRGYTPITAVTLRDRGEVARVADDPFSEPWAEGWYIVCAPEFVDCKPLRMKGFQGWHWFDRTRVPS
jgi:hypothetical protein